MSRVDYRTHPERYVIGRGEQGVFKVEPYKSELLPLWTFRTPALAKRSSRAIYRAFVAYGRDGDFVGMDMARKYLQMGWTRSRRYANRSADEKQALKAQSAAIFKALYDKARTNRRYLALKAAFKCA